MKFVFPLERTTKNREPPAKEQHSHQILITTYRYPPSIHNHKSILHARNVISRQTNVIWLPIFQHMHTYKKDFLSPLYAITKPEKRGNWKEQQMLCEATCHQLFSCKWSANMSQKNNLLGFLANQHSGLNF